MSLLRRVSTGAAQRPRFYTVAEVADMFGVSDMTLYREIRDGKFPAIKIRGRYIVPAKVIDALESDAMTDGLVDAADYAVPGGAA
ncbi:MAG: helix-turn-helix domain-containing protein [Micromonosporaceae bacterium]